MIAEQDEILERVVRAGSKQIEVDIDAQMKKQCSRITARKEARAREIWTKTRTCTLSYDALRIERRAIGRKLRSTDDQRR